MNRFEHRVRGMINPYSTAVTGWWCRAGRYTWLGRVVTDAGSRLSRRAAPGPDKGAAEASRLHPPTRAMADRRAAIDAVLAERGEGGPAGPEHD